MFRKAETLRGAIAGLCAVVPAVLLAACGPETTNAAGLPQGCRRAPATTGARSVIAVLAGITTTDQSPQASEHRAAAFGEVVCAGFAAQSHLVGDVIGQGVGDGELWFNDRLTASGPNPMMRLADATARRNQAKKAFEAVQARTSAGPADVLSALHVLHDHLAAVVPAGEVDVVVMSNMLNATPILRLDDPAVRGRSPYDLYESIADQHLVPDCRGWHVYVIGAARTTSGGLDISEATALRAFWALFFHRCGAELVVYDGELTAFPVHGPPIAPPAPPVAVVDDPRTGISIRLPGSVLFETAQATLRSDAEPALMQALEVVQRYPRRTISVAGFTDDIGGLDANQRLSEARARTVAGWLAGHGIAEQRIEAVGYGAQRPVADNATPEGRQQNRRVELSLPSVA